MYEKLNKIRQEKPSFDRDLVNNFAKTMPKLFNIMIDGYMYNNHIGSKDVALLAQKYITNNKGENIGFKFNYDDIVDIAKNYTNLQDSEYYPTDLWVWANVKYGDIGHIINDPQSITRAAISDLEDEDFPYFEASQRAYCWLKKHISNDESLH